jgi:filamentous hemagglutinin
VRAGLNIAVTGNMTANNGNLTLAAAAGSATTNGTLEAFGNLSVRAAAINALGNMTTHQSGALTLNATAGDLGTKSLTANSTLTLTASGNVTTNGTLEAWGSLSVRAAGVNALGNMTTHQSGTLTLNATAGDLWSRSLTSNSTLTLAALSGNVTTNGTLEAWGNLSVMARGINALGAMMTHQNGTLMLAAAAGNVMTNGALNSSGALNVTANVNINVSGDMTTSGGVLTLNATTGSVTTNGTLTSGTGLDVRGGVNINAVGNMTAQNGTLTLNAAAGDVATRGDLTASTSLNITAQRNVTATGNPGNLTANNGNLTVIAWTGDINAGGTEMTAPNGSVILSAPQGNITAHEVHGQSVTVNASIAGGIVTMNSEVIAGNGIGDDVYFSGNQLHADTSGLNISNAEDVTFVGFGNMTVGGGNFVITNVAGNITTWDNAVLAVNGDLSWTARGIDLQNVNTTVTNGQVSLNSTGGGMTTGAINAVSGTMTLNANGTLTTGALAARGALTATSQGNLNTGAVTSTNSSVSLTSTTGSVTTGAIDAQGGSLNITAANGINAGASGLTASGSMTLTSTGTGNLLQAGNLQAGSDITATFSGGTINLGNLIGGNLKLTATGITLGTVEAHGTLEMPAAGSVITTKNITAQGDVKITYSKFTLQGNEIRATGHQLSLKGGSFFGNGETTFDSSSLELDGTYDLQGGILKIEATDIQLGGGFSLTNTRVEFVKGIEGSNLQLGSEVSLAAPEIEVEAEAGEEGGLEILKELGLLEEEAGVPTEPSKVMEPMASERAKLGVLPTPMEAARTLNQLMKLLQNAEMMKAVAAQVENADDPEKKFDELRKTDEWLKNAQAFLKVAKALLLQKGKDPKFAGQLFMAKFCAPLRGQYPATYGLLEKMAAE